MRTRVWYAVLASALAAGGTARADVTLNFFGDINYSVVREEGETTNSFQAATLDVFATQTEGKFSFIGEMIVEALGSNEFEVDIDRLEVSYKPRAWLRFRAGRLRSAFGYYGDAYQNGKYFMTPVSWPSMYEGDGVDGVVPSHSIGVHVDAAYPLGDERGKLTVDAEVLNGRGLTVGEVPVFQDENNHKAVNLRLRYVGDGSLNGLVVGGNIYVDDIPPDAPAEDGSRPGHAATHELVLAGHAAYVTDHLHLISEIAWFRHKTHDTQMTSRTIAAFAEAGYVLDDLSPYIRFEYTHFYEDDPYFLDSEIPRDDLHMLSAGIKYAASASVAVKIEGAADLQTDDRRVVAQAAFAF
jgi:hypothetical protein